MNARQILAINEGINGHNLLILGQSVTGKSYLINEIKDQLKKGGKSVAITGTTGVAKITTSNYLNSSKIEIRTPDFSTNIFNLIKKFG
jgi:DNA replication protein DnaC